MQNRYYPFVNMPLPYEYSALEPYIDEKTMYLHHNRHLQNYIDKLNETLEKFPGLQRLSLEQLICSAAKFPREIHSAITDNAGGVYNHRFFFEGLSHCKSNPSGKLLCAIEKQYKSTDNFYSEFKSAALSVFGSGYAWLTSNNGTLKIIASANQNSFAGGIFRPILTIDVWEHAYYLKHYNMRADYIDDWFNIINWKFAEENFEKSIY